MKITAIKTYVALFGRRPRALLKVETDEGLYFAAVISQTDRGREVRQLIEDDVIGGVSSGFRPVRGGTRNLGLGRIRRDEVALTEISIVTNPAYENARVITLRSGTDTPTSPHAERLALRARLLRLKGT